MKKDKLQIIISALIIILLSSFVWGYNVFGIRTTITATIDKIALETDVKIECPQNIIPSEIDLMMGENNKLYGYDIRDGGGFEDFLTYYQDPEWVDGQKMTIYPPRASGEVISFSKSHCIKGSQEGQNINYYYCNVGYSKTTTDISEEGEIGKTTTISYNIKLTLEEKEHLRTVRGTSIDRYDIISSICIKI